MLASGFSAGASSALTSFGASDNFVSFYSINGVVVCSTSFVLHPPNIFNIPVSGFGYGSGSLVSSLASSFTYSFSGSGLGSASPASGLAALFSASFKD